MSRCWACSNRVTTVARLAAIRSGSAVAQAALHVLIDENLFENSAELGSYFKGRLQRIESDVIKEVRGKGLFIGMELHEPARRYCEALRERGIL